MWEDIRALEEYAQSLRGYCLEVEDDLTSAGWRRVEPPVSDTEVFPRNDVNLDGLRQELTEAEAIAEAARERVYRLRVQIQDEELRLRWQKRAWKPPKSLVVGTGEAMVPEETSGQAIIPADETAPPVPLANQRRKRVRAKA
ncbi:MAG: hypothetical protein J2P57_16930, partial [Acidimicrobiaceae bacterium]|nr:hypothetical protein [Acidimicrobiaceae bacterium]